VTNMLALLGWHPSGNQEMFSMEELIAEFSLERVSKSGAKFDLQKALWFNQQYLQQKPLNEQYEILKPLIEAKGYDTCEEYVEQVVVLMREKVQFAKDVVEEGYYFFEAPKQYDEEVVRKKWKAETNAHILGLAQAFEGLAADANAEAYENAFKSYCETLGIKTGEVLQPLRVAVSGAPMGPPIWEMIALIGRDYVLPRLREAAAKIQPVVA
jgi:glutamyl-tRNA synthetase